MVKGKRKSIECSHCGFHPTRRVYRKGNGIFQGIAWLCENCGKFTKDSD